MAQAEQKDLLDLSRVVSGCFEVDLEENLLLCL